MVHTPGTSDSPCTGTCANGAGPETGLGTVPGTGLDSPEVVAIQRRTLRVVVLSQILGGAGLAAGITVGALLAQDLLGSENLTGVPTALFTLGSALAAFLVGRITQVRGRRIGLGFGFIAGGVGAIGVIVAATANIVPLLFISLFIYGAGTATNLQARYAGTDLADPRRRGQAVSIAMVSTTLGAVAGPNLVGPLGGFAEALGLPALTGPFLLAAVAYIAAGLGFVILLRPDPFLVAQEVVGKQMRDGTDRAPRADVGAWVGAAVMVLTQVAMVAVMTMTPVHMRGHGHGLEAVGLVIGLHVGAMYLPSLVTGRLVDRIGRVWMSIASGVTLLAAGLVSALSPAESLTGITVGLMLLGLGWNFGLIAGTTMVIDATVPENRAKTQGTIDVFIALAGAGSGMTAGLIVAWRDFPTLAVFWGSAALLVVPAMLLLRRDSGKSAPAS